MSTEEEKHFGEHAEYWNNQRPEPSADVVGRLPEAITGYYPFDALMRANGVESPDEKLAVAQMAAHAITKALAPIIEAEVERRVRERAAAPESNVPVAWWEPPADEGRGGFVELNTTGRPSVEGLVPLYQLTVRPASSPSIAHQHDPDDWPERGMEEKP